MRRFIIAICLVAACATAKVQEDNTRDRALALIQGQLQGLQADGDPDRAVFGVAMIITIHALGLISEEEMNALQEQIRSAYRAHRRDTL